MYSCQQVSAYLFQLPWFWGHMQSPSRSDEIRTSRTYLIAGTLLFLLLWAWAPRVRTAQVEKATLTPAVFSTSGVLVGRQTSSLHQANSRWQSEWVRREEHGAVSCSELSDSERARNFQYDVKIFSWVGFVACRRRVALVMCQKTGTSNILNTCLHVRRPFKFNMVNNLT